MEKEWINKVKLEEGKVEGLVEECWGIEREVELTGRMIVRGQREGEVKGRGKWQKGEGNSWIGFASILSIWSIVITLRDFDVSRCYVYTPVHGHRTF